MTINAVIRTAALAAMLLPSVAFAHTGHEVSGFQHGFIHPLSGLDHILAMVMVGIFAYQLGGRALWLVPSTFVFVMAIGGLLGMAGFHLPFVETGITLSVIAAGAIVAFGVKAPVGVAMGIVGLFAIFHGHAHGAEMPAAASGLAYATGFMIATASLHAAGIGVGFLLGKASAQYSPVIVRSVGAFAAVTGIAILGGVL